MPRFLRILLLTVLIGSVAREASATDRSIAIGVGTMADGTRGRSARIAAMLKASVMAELRALGQVPISPARPGARLPARRNVSSFLLEGSVSDVRVQRVGRGLRVRCSISLMVLSDPNREIRMVLSSAATAEQSRANAGAVVGLQAKAIEGAVHGVVGRLLRTLSAQVRGAVRAS